MLFVGVTAFAMQFLAIGLVAAFLSQLGEWLGHLFKLGAAMVIAAWLTLKTDSPSSRVKEVDALWFFGAAGALTMFLAGRSLYLFSYSYAELLIQIGFVLSFIWLLAHLDSGETRAEEASGATLFMVFVGLYVTLNTVFSLAKILMDRLPFATHGVLAWLPLIISVGLIIMLMRWLQLKQRLSNDAPGRGLLRAGVVIFVLAVLAGGSIYAGSETGGRLSDLFPVLVTLAVVVLPLTIVAQLLVGIGLLRMCFTLGPRPR
jgi:hypothetical protein